MNPPGLVIFDLDGVLRFSRRPDHLILSMEDYVVPDSISESVHALLNTGVVGAVATNQGANILELRHQLDKVETASAKIVGITNMSIDAVDSRLLHNTHICIHAAEAWCDCRKPREGMLNSILSKFVDIEPVTFMVGDAWSDIVAARRVGIFAIKVRDFKYAPLGDTSMPSHVPDPDAWFPTVEQAIEYIRMKLNV